MAYAQSQRATIAGLVCLIGLALLHKICLLHYRSDWPFSATVLGQGIEPKKISNFGAVLKLRLNGDLKAAIKATEYCLLSRNAYFGSTSQHLLLKLGLIFERNEQTLRFTVSSASTGRVKYYDLDLRCTGLRPRSWNVVAISFAKGSHMLLSLNGLSFAMLKPTLAPSAYMFLPIGEVTPCPRLPASVAEAVVLQMEPRALTHGEIWRWSASISDPGGVEEQWTSEEHTHASRAALLLYESPDATREDVAWGARSLCANVPTGVLQGMRMGLITHAKGSLQTEFRAVCPALRTALVVLSKGAWTSSFTAAARNLSAAATVVVLDIRLHATASTFPPLLKAIASGVHVVTGIAVTPEQRIHASTYSFARCALVSLLRTRLPPHQPPNRVPRFLQGARD